MTPSALDSVHVSDETVHLWAADLDDPNFEVDALAELLSQDERLRAARFRFERDRRRFTIGRALLRILLGEYLNQSPATIEFSYGPSGKPGLQTGSSEPPIHFNLAHADSCGLFAFGRRTQLGVDVEQLRPIPELVEIADRFFSPQEADLVRNSTPADRVPAFFRCWTRKEAFIKALGEGLSRPLDTFAVSVEAGRSPRIEWVTGDPDATNQWSLHHLEPRPGFVGALALPRADVQVQWRQLSPDHAYFRGSGQ